MIPEWLGLGGGAIVLLVAAKWLWKGAAIAFYFKMMAVALAVLGGLSLVGIVSVDVGRITDLARGAFRLVSDLVLVLDVPADVVRGVEVVLDERLSGFVPALREVIPI